MGTETPDMAMVTDTDMVTVITKMDILNEKNLSFVIQEDITMDYHVNSVRHEHIKVILVQRAVTNVQHDFIKIMKEQLLVFLNHHEVEVVDDTTMHPITQQAAKILQQQQS